MNVLLPIPSYTLNQTNEALEVDLQFKLKPHMQRRYSLHVDIPAMDIP